MKKILMLLALAALAFTSCMKEDENYKRLKRVEPGINIYNGTMTMQRIAMQPFDAAVRLAIVMAEAHAQEPDNTEPDLTKIMVNDDKDNLFEGLLGKQVTLSKIEKGYKLVFETKTLTDYYMCGGTMEVHTNGKQLVETTADEPWQVFLGEDFKVVVLGGYGSQEVLASASSIKLHYNQIDAYKLNLVGFRANTKETTSIRSDWSANMTLTPPTGGESLAYNGIKKERFGIDGMASGASCVTFDSKSSTELSYRVSGGTAINYLDLASGTVECALIGTNDYNNSMYEKGKTVEVRWSQAGENKTPTAMLTWNMITENLTGYIR